MVHCFAGRGSGSGAVLGLLCLLCMAADACSLYGYSYSRSHDKSGIYKYRATATVQQQQSRQECQPKLQDSNSSYVKSGRHRWLQYSTAGATSARDAWCWPRAGLSLFCDLLERYGCEGSEHGQRFSAANRLRRGLGIWARKKVGTALERSKRARRWTIIEEAGYEVTMNNDERSDIWMI